MALFDMPCVRTTREADMAIAKKAKVKSASAVVTHGTGLVARINLIKKTVIEKLGKYKDMYAVVNDEESLKKYVDTCIKNGIVAIDTETTGLDPMIDKIAGIGLYTPTQKGIYIPINHVSYITGIKSASNIDSSIVTEQIERIREAKTKVVMHNAKFDIRVLKHAINVELECYFDTLLASQLLNENEPHRLKALHQKYVLNGEGDAWSFGKLFDNIQFTMIPVDIAYMYSARDPHITYELYEFQLPYMTLGTEENTEQNLQKVQSVFWNIEMKFLKVAIEMEENGIALDIDYQKELKIKYSAQREEKLQEFYAELNKYQPKIDAYMIEHPGCKLSNPINISSPLQLSILFYDILQIGEIDRKEPRGTGEKIMSQIDLPIAKIILDYRGIDKLMSTYIDKLPTCINPQDNKVHCTFNQYGAKTGRLSSDSPNLQNIPSHNTDIRKMFVADKDYVLMSADYSQQEVKVFAELSKDPVMIKALTDGKDVYAMVASVAFNTAYEDCMEFRPDGSTNKEGKARRTQAKRIVLGILYGRGIKSIAEQLNTTEDSAQKIKDDVIRAFPNFKTFEDATIQMAEQLGYVTTLWGRKRRLPEMQLPMYEFEYMQGYGDDDPLSFEDKSSSLSVPLDVQQRYIRMLKHASFGRKRAIFEKINAEGVHVIDNERKIQDATGKCVNARVQGSAADLSKLAGIEIYNNQRLRELGFKLLIPVHDEFIATCPIVNAKECSVLFSQCMSNAAKELSMPINCDVEISKRWYGESIEV